MFGMPRNNNVVRFVATCLFCSLAVAGCIETDPPSKDSSNHAPVAAPGTSRAVNVGDVVALDGSGSYDEDGDSLTYEWELEAPAGSSAALSSASDAAPTFTPDVAGDYSVTLVVKDALSSSAPATIVITASVVDLENTPPVADAGIDRQVEVGSSVMLDGSRSSDAEGDALTYSWELVSVPESSAAAIADAEATATSFVADVVGVYLVRLVVNDGKASSNPTTIEITSVAGPPSNQPPVAKVGQDLAVEVGDAVTLDGSNSQDPEMKPLTFSWALEVPNGSFVALDDATSATPAFTPDAIGTYTATLIVNDGELDSEPESVKIQVAKDNTAPTARAGMNLAGVIDEPVELDGSMSSDPEGDELTFAWMMTGKPVGSSTTLADATSAKPTFTPDLPGNYVVSLTVSDAEFTSPEVTVIIEVVDPCIVISEYVEADSFNKAIELYNCSGGPLNLNRFGACIFWNGDRGCGQSISLGTEVVPDGETLVLCNGAAEQRILDVCDLRTTVANFSGDDRIMLYYDANASGSYDTIDDEIVDSFGQLAVKPDETAWQDVTYRRCNPEVFGGVSEFDVTQYYTEHPSGSFDNLGVPPTLTGCSQ